MTSELMELNKQEVAVESESFRTKSQRLIMPKTDIYESQDLLILLADMPGVKLENVDITLEQNILTIHGPVEQSEIPGHDLSYSEYGGGDFHRVFALSNEIDRDGIQASLKNGVLKLILPKSKRALPRKITVQTE